MYTINEKLGEVRKRETMTLPINIKKKSKMFS